MVAVERNKDRLINVEGASECEKKKKLINILFEISLKWEWILLHVSVI